MGETGNEFGADLGRTFVTTGFSEGTEDHAEWRDEKGEQCPDDMQNRDSADTLWYVSEWVEANPESPILVRLNAALKRLYDSERAMSFAPSEATWFGMWFGQTKDPVGALEKFAAEIETFLGDGGDETEA